MKSDFRQALDQIRDQAKSESELGTFFESLTKVFLENDPIQQQEYEKNAKNESHKIKKDKTNF